MVDAPGLGPGLERGGGSSPLLPTRAKRMGQMLYLRTQRRDLNGAAMFYKYAKLQGSILAKKHSRMRAVFRMCGYYAFIDISGFQKTSRFCSSSLM